MIHYDLFAGIGGFSLAVDDVFRHLGVRHVFAETDRFCRAVLRKHWPAGTFHDDVALGGHEEDPSILTGGFPCQPFSIAGSRRGTADDRYLWPEMLGAIRRVQPDWIVAENVPGLVAWQRGLVFERVCADMEAEGYAVGALIIPAVGVGAPHRRDRAWIVAAAPDSCRHRLEVSPDDDLRPVLPVKLGPARRRPDWSVPWQTMAAETCDGFLDDGVPRSLDGTAISGADWARRSVHAYGNAIVPGVAANILKAVRHAWESSQTAGPTAGSMPGSPAGSISEPRPGTTS